MIRYTYALVVASAVLLASPLGAIERISVPLGGGEANDDSFVADVTPDGRFVVIVSSATNLLGAGLDTNGLTDVFVLDRNNGSLERVSVNSTETQVTDFGSNGGSISDDGNLVCFTSTSAQLVGGDTNGTSDAFLRNRSAGTTERVSLTSTGTQISTGLNQFDGGGQISGDGSAVVFVSADPNVVPGDTNGGNNNGGDVFRRTLGPGAATIRVSVSDGDLEAVYSQFGRSFSATISDDGNLVAFLSSAENLVNGDDNGHQDMFLRNVTAGTTVRVSLTSSGAQQENGGTNERGAINGNGRFAVFGSDADNILPGDTNGLTDVFIRDLQTGTTELVNVASNSSAFITDGFTSFPNVSPDGRYVGFSSSSDQLDIRKTAGFSHGYIRDRQTKTTQTVNITTAGEFGSGPPPFDSGSSRPIFANGGVYVFDSDSSNLVPGDTNNQDDVFQSEYIPLVVVDNSALCASLKNTLKKLKKKFKKLKKSRKGAAAKKIKKKIKAVERQLKALGC